MSFRFQNDDWFKPKKYLHFDFPLKDSDRKEVNDFVTDPSKVASHPFYPFITYEVTKYKMTEEDGGTRHLDDTGVRPLSYASHWDSQIYSYYARLMSALYEQRLLDAGIGENVLAFRKLTNGKGESKCNIHLANEAFEKISSLGDCRVYAFDIKSFFDNLNHEYLKKCWCELLGEERLPADHFQIYKSLSTHSIVKKSDLYKTFSIPKKNPRGKGVYKICGPEDFRKKVRGGKLIESKTVGIPQGSAMSAFLANLYMFEFDKNIQALMVSKGGYYFRYCDDILCILPLSEDFDLQKVIEIELDKIKLWINPNKTEDVVFRSDTTGEVSSDKPIQYLGFLFDGKRKLIRTPSISRYRRKAKKAIRLAKATMKKYNSQRLANGESPRSLYRRKLYKKYFHTGKTNFIRYGFRASEVMDSKEIRGQMKKLSRFLLSEIGP